MGEMSMFYEIYDFPLLVLLIFVLSPGGFIDKEGLLSVFVKEICVDGVIKSALLKKGYYRISLALPLF
jgi:hypothetical protein